MKLDDALQGVSSLAFDTAPIIYFVEANPTYDKLVTNIFNRVAAGELERLDLGHQPERSLGASRLSREEKIFRSGIGSFFSTVPTSTHLR